MNLGAPILDVQTTITSDSETSSGSSTPVIIVSNGVVTAPGFDPIVITSTGSNSNGASGGKEVFIPTVPII